MSPQTDIVIAVRGTRQYPIEKDFEVCIEGLVKYTQNYRLILVDDGSDAEGRAVVSRIADQFPTCTLIRTHRQNWFTRAYNKGLRQVRTPRAVMLNADTVLGEGWLEELYGVWDEGEQVVGRVGLVGAVFSEPEQRRYANSVEVDYVTGHCWLVSMQAISEASAARGNPGWYLDETRQDAIHIKSDVYLCWELNRLKWATLKSFKAQVGHIGGRAWGYNLGEALSVRLDQVSE